MDISTVILLVLIGFAVVIVLTVLMVIGFFLLIALAAFVYVWSHVYPWVKRIALWHTRRENFFSLVTLLVILAVLLSILIILAMSVSLFFILPILAPFVLFIPVILPIVGAIGASYVSPLFIPLFILLIPAALVVELGILVWAIRLIRWLFARWRIWLVVTYLNLRLRTRPGRLSVKISGTTSKRVSSGVSRDRHKTSKK